MDRLLIKSIEGRILTGVIMFVGIMILIGWVAINEEARMQAFVQQHTGRAIERGAELYASNCSSCHGNDGLGGVGKAPALSNPHLFGYDALSEYNDAIVAANRALVNIDGAISVLNLELSDAESPPSEERIAEIEAELATLDTQIEAENANIDQAIIDRAAMIVTLKPATDRGLYPLWQTVDDNELTENLVANGSRLAQVAWSGDLHGYITTTLIHGRPGSINVWPNSGGGMVAWSQRAGGPLRDDEIEDLAAYILNWDKGDNWTLEDFFAVQQYGKPLADGSILIDNDAPPPVDTDVATIMETIEADGLVGDATAGEQAYLITYGCSACHLNGLVAPDTEGTWTRVNDERITLDEFAGYTAEQYLIESIVQAAVYDYPDDNYLAGAMPADFGDRITYQDMADIIAFLQTKE
jgi:mono/diheme cytochrome c family protein